MIAPALDKCTTITKSRFGIDRALRGAGASASLQGSAPLAKTKISNPRTRRQIGAKTSTGSTRRQAKKRAGLKEKPLFVRVKIENAKDEQDRELRLLIDQAIQERFSEIEIEYDD